MIFWEKPMSNQNQIQLDKIDKRNFELLEKIRKRIELIEKNLMELNAYVMVLGQSEFMFNPNLHEFMNIVVDLMEKSKKLWGLWFRLYMDVFREWE